LELAVAHSTERFFTHCFQIKLEFGRLVFVEGSPGKPENLEKNPQNKVTVFITVSFVDVFSSPSFILGLDS